MPVNSFVIGMKRGAAVLLCGLLTALFAGCDRNDSYNDHVPPHGKGALIIDNHSGDDISIFADGTRVGGVDGSDYTVIDLDPGFFRVVLTGDHVDRSFRDDVDILDGRLTILDVRASSGRDYYTYDVVTTFD